MVAKLAIVEEEADESVYWLELLVDAGAITRRRVNELIGEGNALVAMTVASRLTLRGEQNRKSKT
jgi:four helix bundle protein